LANDETGAPSVESGRIVQIARPSPGAYDVQVTGRSLGTYTLSIRAFSQDGRAQPEVRIEGVTGMGSTSSFQIEFSSAAGASSTVARVGSFASTLSDVDNFVRLGLIGNLGVGLALSKQIRAAADAAARGQTSAKVQLLEAFQSVVRAQTSVHIRGIASGVLLEDASSLLTQ
jgi:hypothetical protein